MAEEPVQKAKKPRVHRTFDFYCIQCDTDYVSERRFDGCLGLRAALCVANGKFHRSFAQKEIYTCRNCYRVKLEVEKHLIINRRMFTMCKGLIARFPALDGIFLRRPDENECCFEGLVSAYKMWTKHDGFPAFHHMIQHFVSTENCMFLPVPIMNGIVTVLEAPGDHCNGRFKVVSVSGDVIGEASTSFPLVELREELGNKHFTVPFDRIYVPDWVCQRKKSTWVQHYDIKVNTTMVRKERELAKKSKAIIDRDEQINQLRTMADQDHKSIKVIHEVNNY